MPFVYVRLHVHACPLTRLGTLLVRRPLPGTNAVYTDPRNSISYPAGLYLSTKMAMPPLGISDSQVDVAIAAGDGTFAKTVVFKFQGAVSPMPYVNLTNLQAVWEAGKSMVRVACNAALAAAWP